MAANLIKIDTTGCNTNYIVFLSNPQGLGRYLTIKDTGTNAQFFASNSIVISTTSGYTFFGGSSKEYIKNTNGFLSFTAMHSNWRLLNTLPYTTLGHAVLSNISTTNVCVTGTISTIGQVMVHSNIIVTGGTDVKNMPTVQGVPLLVVDKLVSTVNGLGTLGYVSSFSLINASFISSVNNLGTYGFISSTQLQSTVANLGNIKYISQASVFSTFQALGSTYLSTPSLVSTVKSLGNVGYISTESLTSTIQGAEGFQYVTTGQYTSTLISLSNKNSSKTISTITGLSILGYISSTQLQSTVAGLGDSKYVSLSQLTSSIISLSNQNTSNLISTVLNLGKHYISAEHMISTLSGISNVNTTTITSTINGLGCIGGSGGSGGIGYISSLSLQSTVAGLGDSKYISVSQLTSTVDGLHSKSLNLLTSTTSGLAMLKYISVSQLVSTVTGFSNVNTSNMISTTNSLGTLYYISSLSLQSTVAGLGSLHYISTGDLVSTTLWHYNYLNSIPSSVAGLGTYGYISTASLTSTIAGITTIISNLPYTTGNGNSFKTVLSNTMNNLGTLGACYISASSLTSTVAGLGTVGYLSTSIFISTIDGINATSFKIDIDSALGSTYASKIQLISSVTSTQTKPIFNIDSFQIVQTASLTNPNNIIEFSPNTIIVNNIEYGNGYGYAFNPLTSKGYYFANNHLVEQLRPDLQTGSSSVELTYGVIGYQDGTNAFTIAFNDPRDIAIASPYSNFYVCDWGNSAIRKVQIYPLSVTTVCTIFHPYLITLNSDSTYAYIITNSNTVHSIYKVSLLNNPTPVLQTTFTTFIQQYQNGSNYIIQGMTLDPSNTFMYLTLGKNAGNSILQYNVTNDTGLLLGTLNAGNSEGPLIPSSNAYCAKFNNPIGILHSRYYNRLYLSDNGNNCIRVIATPIYASTMSGLDSYRVVKTITPFNANITSAQTNYLLIASNSILTTSPNIYLSNSIIYCTNNVYAVGNTVTATTFTTSSGRNNGVPSWGFYYGDGSHVTSISDSRLKENIVPLSNALQIVRGLQAVSYTKDEKRWIGYIAQDVEEVLPVIVSTDDSPNKWKSIQYTNLPGLLIEAVKELRAKYSRIEALLSNVSRPS